MWNFFLFNKAIVLWQTAKSATVGALHLCGLPLDSSCMQILTLRHPGAPGSGQNFRLFYWGPVAQSPPVFDLSHPTSLLLN